MLGLFLLLGIILHTLSASYVTHPNINIDLLGISGSYDGISLYTDTSQLTQIPPHTSSVLSYSNDSIFQLLASSNINGIIHDTCILHNVVYLAGNFTTINGFSANHIASLDLSSGQFSPLHQGLDGPVNSVYCDPITQFVYVGGSFLAPVNTDSAYSASLAHFGGSVAIWNTTGWTNVPWKGVNGHINSIVRHNDNLLFGGLFDKTMDGQADYAPASSMIKLSSTGASGTNTLSSSNTPSSIVCADTKNNSAWTLTAGKTGTWQTSFNYYSVNPSLVRIGNSKVPGYQTKQFGVRSIDGQGYFQMSYLDHLTNQTNFCTNNCILSNDTNLEFQDYRILNTSLTFGIAIDVFSWYGVGGGLSSVSVYQSENFIYALDAEAQSSPCASESQEPTVKTVGNWTKVTKDATSYLYSSSSQNASITFYPTVAESGIYEVYLYTADCTGACANPVDVDIQISTSDGQTQTVFVSTQTKATSGTLIYTGYFDVTSGFKPSLQMMSAHNATKSGSIAAHSFQLVKESSVNELKSIIQYNPTSQNIQATSLPWGALADNLPSKSIVYDMKAYESDLYIAGSFQGVDEANSSYFNIVQLNSNSKKIKSLANADTNGSIRSLTVSSKTGEIFAAGNFTVKGKQIENVARYSLKQTNWNSLDNGVNGSVHAVHQINDRVLVSGEFSKLPNGSAVFGNGWWDVDRQAWTLDNIPYLSGIVYSTLEYNKAVYFSGNIQGAQKHRSFGSSFITKSGLSQLPFYPINDHPVVSAGVIYDNSTSILGGQFSLEKNIQNIAIYQEGVWSGVSGSNWEGVVRAMTVHHDMLYVGGQFSGSGTSGFAGFDLKNRTLKLAPEVKGFDGASASVNVVLSSSSDNQIIIGGNFSSIGNFSCPVVCMLGTADYQWTALGSGLSGEVTDIKYIDDKLVATGNMTLNQSPITIAEYDFSRKVWGPFATANLPGPSVALTHDNITKNTYISGQNSVNETTYLRVWNGQQFNPIDHGLGYGSVISKMYSIPIKEDGAQNTILATGFINLGAMGNVSAAFFDGKSWIPYLVTSSSLSSPSSVGGNHALLSSLFYFNLPHVASVIKHYLSTSIVILVSIAISLGIVSAIVFITMAIILIKKRNQAKTDPQSDPNTYYGKAPRTAESLLAALKDSGEDTNNYSAEKLDTLEPEAHIYSMSKAISTDYLSDPSTRGTPLSPAPVHSIHQMNTNSFYNPISPTSPISNGHPVIFK